MSEDLLARLERARSVRSERAAIRREARESAQDEFERRQRELGAALRHGRLLQLSRRVRNECAEIAMLRRGTAREGKPVAVWCLR